MTNEKLPIKSLYLHYPFCRHLCNYCDFFKSVPKSKSQVSEFEEKLGKMFEIHENFLRKEKYQWKPLESLYIGGGTPSLWGRSGAAFLTKKLEEYRIKLDNTCEFTLEVNPGSWTDESLESWQKVGVNRFSLGIQSLDSRFIKYLDRIHNIDDVYDTLNKFSKMKANFSVDFMLGLPFSESSNRDINKELEEIFKFDPPHISLYILTVKDHYIHQDHLPSEDYIEKEFLLVSKILQDRGYSHYEVSNFSKKGKESQHNLMYWKSGTVAALGPSATGLLSEKRKRYKWKVSGPEFIEENLSEKEYQLEKIYMNLRTFNGLSLDEYNPSGFDKIYNDWINRGLAHFENNKVILTSKGYLILDSLMDDLFKYFPESFS